MTATRTRDLGRAIIGLGLTLLGLGMITLAAEPMRAAPVGASIGKSVISHHPADGTSILRTYVPV